MLSWDALGHAMALSTQAVQQRAIMALIAVELTQLDRDEMELIQQYGLLSAVELEQAMQAGTVPEHPTWEEFIHWEAIEDRRQALKELLRGDPIG